MNAKSPDFTFTVHPDAAIVPPLSNDEYHSLVENIKSFDLLIPIKVLKTGKTEYQILDGVHRYKACTELNKKFTKNMFSVVDLNNMPVDEYVSAMNNRRHLTTEGKRQWAREILKLHPDMSSREIGRRVCLDHKTVENIRGEIPHNGPDQDTTTKQNPTPPAAPQEARDSKRTAAKKREADKAKDREQSSTKQTSTKPPASVGPGRGQSKHTSTSGPRSGQALTSLMWTEASETDRQVFVSNVGLGPILDTMMPETVAACLYGKPAIVDALFDRLGPRGVWDRLSAAHRETILKTEGLVEAKS